TILEKYPSPAPTSTIRAPSCRYGRTSENTLLFVLWWEMGRMSVRSAFVVRSRNVAIAAADVDAYRRLVEVGPLLPCNRAVCPFVQMAMSPLTQEAPQLPTPPTPPTPPLPQVPDRVIRIGGPDGMTIELPTRPLTGREVAALRQRGSELSRQLNSASNRRDQLAGQLEDAQGANKAGIEARIAQLDQRIMGIESDIAQNGRLLASAPASALANANSEARVTPFGLNPNQ